MRQINNIIRRVDEQRVFSDPQCEISETDADKIAKAEVKKGKEIYNDAIKTFFEISGRITQTPITDGYQYSSDWVDLGKVAGESDLPISIRISTRVDFDFPRKGLEFISIYCKAGDDGKDSESDSLIASITPVNISISDGEHHNKVNPADSADMRDVAELLDLVKMAEKVKTESERQKVSDMVNQALDLSLILKESGLLTDIGDDVWVSDQYGVNDRKRQDQFKVQFAVTFFETGLAKSVLISQQRRPLSSEHADFNDNSYQLFQIDRDGIKQLKGRSNWGSNIVSPGNKNVWKVIELGVDSIRTKTSAKIRKIAQA